ncbi:hypothetical protein HI914_02498 [Erysiphe necator]|nr:hypothetical protein HI914_02498 [Erysiphe necator]
MDEDRSEKGTSLCKLVPVMTKLNKTEWFQLVEQVLEGDEAQCLLTHINKEYAHVRDSARVVEPDAKWTSHTTEDEGENIKWWILPDKDLEYKKAQINFRLNIRLKISEIDKDMMDEKVDIPAQIVCLKRRYNLVSYTTGAGKIVAFTTCPSVLSRNKNFTDFMWKLFVAGLHPSLSCPYAEIGFQAAKRARIRREGEETDEDSKVYLPPRRIKGNPIPYKTDRVKSSEHGPKSSSSSS